MNPLTMARALLTLSEFNALLRLLLTLYADGHA